MSEEMSIEEARMIVRSADEAAAALPEAEKALVVARAEEKAGSDAREAAWATRWALEKVEALERARKNGRGWLEKVAMDAERAVRQAEDAWDTVAVAWLMAEFFKRTAAMAAAREAAAGFLVEARAWAEEADRAVAKERKTMRKAWWNGGRLAAARRIVADADSAPVRRRRAGGPGRGM